MAEAALILAILAAWDASRRWAERDQARLEDLEERVASLEPMLARLGQVEKTLGEHGRRLTKEALGGR